ncbi:hypothetical protein LNQ81_12645 [Myroides sp. M-43]|uniref:tetratricopeptide repeat-containing sensor histidine kinase n=1 Tax=Myroides oncorhynchi TaxID=2893756 RepID=UPI001E4BCB71|nr:tetratricopeptide repeat-containing sensor histidine kinase [Myroides oncorhynchi]MCC9043521.1 hypothetical protein [Myroides oncorhynchi]
MHSTINNYINDYNAYLADSLDFKKTDSIGELVLCLANSRYNRGLIREFISKTNSEKKYSDRLLDYSVMETDTFGIASALLLTGKYYTSKFMTDSSYYYFSQAENFFLKINDSIHLSEVYFHKALLLSKNGVYSEAEKQILKSVNYNTNVTSLVGRFRQYIIIGDVFSGLGMYDDALHFYNQSYELLESKEYLYEESFQEINLRRIYVLDNAATVYMRQGKYKEATELLEKAINNYVDFTNINSERYYAYLAVNLAELNIKKKELTYVHSLLNQAIRIGIKNKNRIILDKAKLELAEYYYLTNQRDLAKPLVEGVFTEVKENDDFKSQLRALEILISYEGKNSSKYFEQYVEISKLFKGEANLVRNNFIRIKEEADLLVGINKQLGDKNKQLMIIGPLLVLVLGGILLIYIYRSKKRKIRLIKMFQKDTEQYYNSIINIQNYLNLAKDRERGNIARELNDGVINKLFAARFSLMQLESEWIEDKKQILVNEIVEVERYIREISHTLVTENIDRVQGFEQLLKELILVEDRKSDIHISIRFAPNLSLETLSHRQKINIYRSLQEILLNVHLHSQANNCKVSFRYKTVDLLEINVIDDGKGFDIRSIVKGYGLLGVKERIEIIKGKFFISSNLGEGTSFIFLIPV